MPLDLTERDGGVKLAVKAVPGASRDRIVGPLGNALKVAVSAPPERGAANKAIIALLAERLAIHPSRITILRGQNSPRLDRTAKCSAKRRFRTPFRRCLGPS